MFNVGPANQCPKKSFKIKSKYVLFYQIYSTVNNKHYREEMCQNSPAKTKLQRAGKTITAYVNYWDYGGG